MMEAICPSETSDDFQQATQLYLPQDSKLVPQKLALSSPAGRLVGIVRWRTQATELFLVLFLTTGVRTQNPT
jgi:hypothetical protein